MTINGKLRKKDFSDMREFLRAAAWAEANMNEWPWGGPKDEDDEFYFAIPKSAPAVNGSLPSGESDPSVTLGCAGADISHDPQGVISNVSQEYNIEMPGRRPRDTKSPHSNGDPV